MEGELVIIRGMGLATVNTVSVSCTLLQQVTGARIIHTGTQHKVDSVGGGLGTGKPLKSV